MLHTFKHFVNSSLKPLSIAQIAEALRQAESRQQQRVLQDCFQVFKRVTFLDTPHTSGICCQASTSTSWTYPSAMCGSICLPGVQRYVAGRQGQEGSVHLFAKCSQRHLQCIFCGMREQQISRGRQQIDKQNMKHNVSVRSHRRESCRQACR